MTLGIPAKSCLLEWANSEFGFLLFNPETIRITALALANPLNSESQKRLAITIKQA